MLHHSQLSPAEIQALLPGRREMAVVQRIREVRRKVVAECLERNDWTEKELKKLQDWFHIGRDRKLNTEELRKIKADFPLRSLLEKKINEFVWTPEEIAVLEKHYDTPPSNWSQEVIDEITAAMEPDKCFSNMKSKAYEMRRGVKLAGIWRKDELELLKTLDSVGLYVNRVSTALKEKIAEMFPGRTISAVQSKLSEIKGGGSCGKSGTRVWTNEQLDIIAEYRDRIEKTIERGQRITPLVDEICDRLPAISRLDIKRVLKASAQLDPSTTKEPITTESGFKTWRQEEFDTFMSHPTLFITSTPQEKKQAFPDRSLGAIRVKLCYWRKMITPEDWRKRVPEHLWDYREQTEMRRGKHNQWTDDDYKIYLAHPTRFYHTTTEQKCAAFPGKSASAVNRMISLWRHLERLKYMNSLGVTTKDDLPAQKIADMLIRDVEVEENIEEEAEQNGMPRMAYGG
ncbi:Protein of unknown function [Pyronema omphalodes CBS 100304]|uniref:Uncharacterized protein n=1 Tax=Pyronema omphalodes (strain CBS 100304) TaxID=1076935 RepID=U4L8X0_PYROM|nr:Protein of unknown function [Pyronema omphalodes CBS 100304]